MTQEQKNRKAIKAALKRFESYQEGAGFTEIAKVYITDKDMDKLAKTKRQEGQKRINWTRLLEDKIKIEGTYDFYIDNTNEGRIERARKINWNLQEYKDFIEGHKKLMAEIESMPKKQKDFLEKYGYAATSLNLGAMSIRQYKRLKRLQGMTPQEIYDYYSNIKIKSIGKSLRSAGLRDISVSFYNMIMKALRQIGGGPALSAFWARHPEFDRDTLRCLFDSDGNEQTASALRKLIKALEDEDLLTIKPGQRWNGKNFEEIIALFEDGTPVYLD